MLKADHIHAIALARRTILIGDELRHEKKADPLGPRRCPRQARKNQMADIACEIIVTPRDVDLLTRDGIGPVAIVFGPAAQRAHVRPCLRLGQVHRAGPFARDQLGQVQFLDRVARVVLQCFDLPLAHQGGELQRQASAAHHLVDRAGQGHRQAHAAKLRVRRHADPAALGNRGETFGKSGRSAHDAVFQLGRVQIPAPLQRRQHVIAKPSGL